MANKHIVLGLLFLEHSFTDTHHNTLKVTQQQCTHNTHVMLPFVLRSASTHNTHRSKKHY